MLAYFFQLISYILPLYGYTLSLYHLQGFLKKQGNKHTDNRNFYDIIIYMGNNGIHQNSLQLLLAFKQLSHYGTNACIPILNKLVSSVCSLPDTDAKELLIEKFKVMKTVGPHSQLDSCLVTTLWLVWFGHPFQTPTILWPVIFNSLDPLRNTLLTCELYHMKQAVTSWLQTLDRRFFYTGTQVFIQSWRNT